MSLAVKLSHNELWIVLRRTFEALYGHRHDHMDMAGLVWWLECYGHDGISHLISALSAMDDMSLERPTAREISGPHPAFECGGQSVLTLGRTVCDLAVAGAASNGLYEISLEALADSHILFGTLTGAARHGFAATAICETSIAVIKPHDLCPVIYEGTTSSDVKLICAQDLDSLSGYYDPASKILISEDAQMHSYRQSLNNGLSLDMSDYDILYEFGNRILVESSDMSRRGAGE